MELQKMGIKFFAEGESAVDLEEYIPIFHRWIQNRVIADHLLIDVADYRHIHQGPGILLVCHEANISMDEERGNPGLLYLRKQPLSGDFSQRLGTMLSTACSCCQRLEREPELQGRLRFRGNEFEVISNDRLLAPNTDEGYASLREALTESLNKLYPDQKFSMERVSEGKERLTVVVSCRGDLIHESA
jgi:hypothetical protein